MTVHRPTDFENLPRRMFDGVGEYGIPEIAPTTYEGVSDWISFNYAKTDKNRQDKGVHMFTDDYQFSRLWRRPDNYVNMLRQYKYVMAPDFSTYTDFPKAIQIYNHYRKHWCAAYLQENGVNIIPTISWSTPDSFDWCFDGEPEGAVVAVSSVGTQNSKEKKRLFLEGYNAMVERLHPDTIIFYGTVPEECMGNIARVKAFQNRFKEAVCADF